MRIRIGKDIRIKWAVLTDGSALELEGRDLTLEMQDPRGELYVRDFTTEGNILTTYFQGKEQTKVGGYAFTLWENKGKENQSVVDRLQAFSLVRYTVQEDLTPQEGEVDVLVDLGTSNLTTMAGGATITVIANLTGYKKVMSTDDLPTTKSTLGFLVDTHLYVWVGEGGDTLEGKYQDCGEFKGERGGKGEVGPRGPQGNSGYQGNIDELEVVNNLTEGGETSALSAEMGKQLKSEMESNKPVLITSQEMSAMKEQGTWETFLLNNKFVCVSEE